MAGEIERLLGTPWVNQHGVTKPLTAQDFMVVAPYNDQVALLRQTLDAERSIPGESPSGPSTSSKVARPPSCSSP